MKPQVNADERRYVAATAFICRIRYECWRFILSNGMVGATATLWVLRPYVFAVIVSNHTFYLRVLEFYQILNTALRRFAR